MTYRQQGKQIILTSKHKQSADTEGNSNNVKARKIYPKQSRTQRKFTALH